MRCSICDAPNPIWIYHNWHCSKCVDIIRRTVGSLEKKDREGEVPTLDEESIEDVFGGDTKDLESYQKYLDKEFEL